MTNEEIKAFIELADMATPGKWNHELERFSAKNVIGVKPTDDRWLATCQPEFNGYNNAEFIAASRTIAPELAKEVLLLREKLSVAVEALENISSWECNECMKASSAEESLKKIRGG